MEYTATIVATAHNGVSATTALKTEVEKFAICSRISETV